MLALTAKGTGLVFTDISPPLMFSKAASVLRQTGGEKEEAQILSQQQSQDQSLWMEDRKGCKWA